MRVLAASGLALLAACRVSAVHHPEAPAIAATVPIGPGGALHGVAASGHRTFAALSAIEPTTIKTTAGPAADPFAGEPSSAPAAKTTIEARDGAHLAWRVVLAGNGGPLAATPPTPPDVRGGISATLYVGLADAADAKGVRPRGEPSATLVALSTAAGGERWRLGIASTEWSVISSIAAATDGGAIVAGSFSGTLRIAEKIVSSAGRSDGFVARITPEGRVAWIVRVGGIVADSVQGVAMRGDRIAIAGTFGETAELLGAPLPAADDRVPFADVFVAELDANGARRWVATFGSAQEDACAGVAIADDDSVAVAATLRDSAKLAGAPYTVHGAADGFVAWYSPAGAPGAVVQIGGTDFDGIRAITAAGDGVVAAGFFSGRLPIGGRTLVAGGGDDSFVAAIAPSGAVTSAWAVTGPGREEVTALARIPGGFVAGIAHTAEASVDGDATKLPAPADPMGGAGLAVRPLLTPAK
ncbi:MAG TPA: hypothetical protein VGM88_30125 [Kofleriaceae bacterium]|jgi:hypothetical protein